MRYLFSEEYYILGVTLGRTEKRDPLSEGIKKEAQKTKTVATVNEILTKHRLKNLKAHFESNHLLISGSFDTSQHEIYLEAVREIEEASGETNMRGRLITESVEGTKVSVLIMASNIRSGGK